MLVIDLNLPIGPESENKWYAMWGEEAVFFSLDTVKRIFEEHPDEKDVKFNINCDGGYVEEGFAIYDYIRTSGRNIYTNIEGGCHSMAIVMLLAAPLENRSANKHSKALIHCVRADYGWDATADELKSMAEELEQEQEQILDIYADRTGGDKDELRAFMKEEKMRTAEWLMDHGFIGSINAYNTNLRKGRPMFNNQKQTDMAKTKQQVLDMASNFLKGLKNVLGTAVNFEHKDNDGNVLFTTEAEDETLEVGMPASPDGTFELPDGRTVVIADGVITEIQEASTEDPDEQELENLRTENENLRNQLTEAANVIEELQAQLSSNYAPKNGNRTATVRKPAASGENMDDVKNQVRERHGLKK